MKSDMKIRHYIAASLLPAILPVALHAQTAAKDTTLNRTVVVEQEYTPEIMDARKVNVMPEVEPLNVEKRRVEYDGALMPARTLPAGVMQPFGAQEPSARAARGYARLGYGNRNNLDVAASYRFDLTERDALNLDFGMDGMDETTTKVCHIPNSDNAEQYLSYDQWSLVYNTRAAVDYSHRFDALKLTTGMNFGLSNLRHRSLNSYLKQKFTKGDWHIGIASTRPEQTIRYKFGTSVMFYERQHDHVIDDNKEILVRTDGRVSGTISPEQQISVGVQMDNYFYDAKLLTEAAVKPLTDFTTLMLNPRYTFERGMWRLQAGAKVDLSFGFGKAFRVAPDVKVEFLPIEPITIYAQATGGRRQNDFRQLEAVSPYHLAVGYSNPIHDTGYETINASLGVKASPLPELSLHLYGGYQELRNDPYIGYHYIRVDYQYVAYEPAFGLTNNYNLYAGLDAAYNYRKIVGLQASVVYNKWSCRSFGGDELIKCYYDSPLSFKPEVQADFRLNLRPIKQLQVEVGYSYESRKGIKTAVPDALNDLYARASYEFLPGFSAYVQGRNLLDKAYQRYHYVDAQGINFLGGISCRF